MSPTAQPSRSSQQYVHAAMGAVAGNTARALPVPGGQPPARERRRTPLSVVPAGPARSRIPFAVFSMLALVVALVVVLMLNISVSSSQYRLVSLRGEEVALAEQNQALTQQLEHLQAPQNLAVAAGELDMVTSPTFGTIDVDSLTVTGSPEPARESDAPPVLVPAPAVNIATGIVPFTPAQAANPGGGSSARADTGDLPDGPTSPDSRERGDEAQAEPPAAAEEKAGEGTIPAPQQAESGQ